MIILEIFQLIATESTQTTDMGTPEIKTKITENITIDHMKINLKKTREVELLVIKIDNL